MTLLYLLDLGCGLLALSIAVRLRLLPFSPPIGWWDAKAPLLVHVLIVSLFGIILPMTNLYDARRIYRVVDEARRVVVGVTTSSLVLAGALYLTYRELPRLIFLYFVGVALVLLLGHRVLLRILYRTARWAPQMPVALIVGAGALGVQTMRSLAEVGATFAGFIDDDPDKAGTRVEGHEVVGSVEAIPEIVARRGVTDIILALPRHEQSRLTHVLVSLWRLPLRVYMIPDFFDLGFARTRVEYLGGLTMIGLREPVIDGFQRVVKRLLDVLLGSLIFLCALPVMGVVAILIRLDSPGSVLFKQQRVGENGRLFTMYKFRTMVADAEKAQDAVTVYNQSGKMIHKRIDDPRVTRIGRVFRRLSLDELPQLINVLRGEMSLVGPRPEMPWVVAQYDPWQYQRLAVPQGMTSWYVVNGRSEVPMHLNTEQDLRHIRQYSVFGDLKILLKSMGAVLKGRGAF